MYSPSIQKQLIESRIRELQHVADVRRARQPLAMPRPRRWRMRLQRPSLIRRLAI